MKRFAAITLAAALFAAFFAGCAGMNYGYDGNVSTTDNGYVNGTNNRTDYSNSKDYGSRTWDNSDYDDNVNNGSRSYDNTDGWTGTTDHKDMNRGSDSGTRNGTSGAQNRDVRPGMGTTAR